MSHRYGPFDLQVVLADPLAEGWYDHDWPTPPELAELSEYLRPGATVFDLGAHQGVIAMMLSRMVGDSGLVVEIEAEAHNVEIARRNAKINQCSNTVIVHAAASSGPGRLRFQEGLNGHVSRGISGLGVVDVEATTIDALAAEHGVPDVVLIDVEGYEEAVLAGGSATLAEHLPVLFVEVHAGCGFEDAGGDTDRMMRGLVWLGYRLSWAPGVDHRDDCDFQPAGDQTVWPDRRFFVVAQPDASRMSRSL